MQSVCISFIVQKVYKDINMFTGYEVLSLATLYSSIKNLVCTTWPAILIIRC